MSSDLREQAERVVASLDDRGAWVERGSLRYRGDGDPTERVIESRTFIENLQMLARFIAAARDAE